MSVKARNRVVDYLVYLAVRVFVCIVQAVPMRAALGFASGLAWVIYTFDKRHRVVAAENLAAAFPEKHKAEVDRLVRGCYRHFCSLLIEIILLPRKLSINSWRSYGKLVNANAMMSLLMSDRPLLMVTGHFGNWEMAGYTLGALGYKTYAIARTLDNPHLERYMKTFRQRTGQTIIAKKDDFDRLEAVMKGGAKVATVADQDAGPRGVFVNFFGRPASAHKAVALMAIEFQARIFVIGVPRVALPMRYEFICADVIDPADYANSPDPVKAITQRYHTAIESLVRKYPEQYFWLHRRWKTRPKSERIAGTN